MTHLLLVAASEPSKVPWYIFGGALAVWAVVVSAIGITQPDFPHGARGQRGVIAISVVLAAIAIGAAIHSG